MKTKPQMRTADATYLYLSRDNNLQKFILKFQQYLKKKLPVKKLPDGSEFYDCGRDHRWPGSGFKPFRHLEVFCEKKGLDDFEVRVLLEDHFGREIVCECQILNDEREIRKKALRRQFGVDFESGEVGLVD